MHTLLALILVLLIALTPSNNETKHNRHYKTAQIQYESTEVIEKRK